jgi:hypothetical protein
VKPPNAGLKLFGGAAFERCLNEFQVAANTLTFPSGEAAQTNELHASWRGKRQECEGAVLVSQH